MTVAIFAISRAWLFVRTRERQIFGLLLSGLLLHAFIDTIYAYLLLGKTYRAGDYIDVGWLIGFAFISLAAIEASVKARNTVSPDKSDRTIEPSAESAFDPVVLLIASAPMLVALMWFGDTLDSRAIPLLVSAISTFLLFAVAREVRGRQKEYQLLAETQAIATELAASETKISALVEIAPEGVISLDTDLNIALFSRGAERIFGYHASEIVGHSLSELIPNRFREHHGLRVAQFRSSEKDALLMSERSEVLGLHMNGKEFAAEASVAKVVVGDQMMFTVMIQDITKRKKVEEQIAFAHEAAEAANRAKSEFLANMSHELRTPLNAVIGFSEIIANQSYGPINHEKYLEYAGDIHEAGALLLELVNDVLDLSKIEAGQMLLSKHEVDVNSTIKSALRMIKERAFQKNLKLEVKLEITPTIIAGDERALRQIILNLLANAVKFTPENGTITVSSIDVSEGRVAVLIVDTGVGIAASDIPNVLKPFGQVAAVDARDHQGTGLGLPLSKRLTELQGGTFGLESELGVGTTVRLTFSALTES